MNRKAMEMDYVFDIAVSAIILVFIVMFMLIFFQGGESKVNNEIIDAQNYNTDSEDLLVFLRSPVTPPENLYIVPSRTTAKFKDGEDVMLVDFDSIKDNTLYIRIDSDKDVENLLSASLSISSGYGSNIALLNGSSDNIDGMLNERGIFPITVTWDEFSAKYDVLFIGCGAPEPKNPSYIRNWLKGGGTIITTDRSVAMLDMIVEDPPIYSDNKSIRSDKVTIIPSREGNRLGLKEFEAKNVYWYSNVMEGRYAEVNAVADYGDMKDEGCSKDPKGCGAAIYEFKYGNGKVYHMTFHMDKNSESIEDDFIDAVFTPSGKNPKDISISFGSSGIGVTPSENGEFKGRQEIQLARQLSENAESCVSFPCMFEMRIKGSQGLLEVGPIKLSKDENKMMPGPGQMTVEDLIVYSYYKNDYASVEERLKDYLETTHGTGVGRIIISEKTKEQERDSQEGDMILYVDSGGFYYGVTRTVAEAKIPLAEPGKWLEISIMETAA